MEFHFPHCALIHRSAWKKRSRKFTKNSSPPARMLALKGEVMPRGLRSKLRQLHSLPWQDETGQRGSHPLPSPQLPLVPKPDESYDVV
jgi:hypothetical protein